MVRVVAPSWEEARDMEGGIMKTVAAAAFGIMVAVALAAAAAASGWAKSLTPVGSPSHVSGVGSGHYKLLPHW
jgi:hypothetical protein